MIKKILFLFFLFSGFLFLRKAYTQNRLKDTAFYQTVLQNTIAAYTADLGENIQLYNGSEYIGTHPGILGNPFFQSDSLQAGAVYYDEVLYPNVAMAYDLAKGEVLIKNHQHISIKLIPEKLRYFSLSSHLFVKISGDSINNLPVNPDFYEVVYNGAVTVLASRKKVVVHLIAPVEHYEYEEKNTYFIERNGIYHMVNNKSSLLEALQDKKAAIKEYFQNNTVSFKKNIEDVLVKTAAYYDQLKK